MHLAAPADRRWMARDPERWSGAVAPSAEAAAAAHQGPDVETLRELIASLAHELNNPLSVIAGQALMLQETTGDARTAERARMIGQAADRGARIIGSILALARKESIFTDTVTVNQVIRDVLEFREPALRASGIRIALHLEDGMPGVAGNACQIGQVVTNLLVNAQQALEEVAGQRHLTVSSTFCEDEGVVVVGVEDSGPGIPPAMAARIFEPFVTSKETGLGVGLSLSRRIVEAHGGTLCLTNGSGRGAAFAIRLPARPATAREL